MGTKCGACHETVCAAVPLGIFLAPWRTRGAPVARPHTEQRHPSRFGRALSSDSDQLFNSIFLSSDSDQLFVLQKFSISTSVDELIGTSASNLPGCCGWMWLFHFQDFANSTHAPCRNLPMATASPCHPASWQRGSNSAIPIPQ